MNLFIFAILILIVFCTIPGCHLMGDSSSEASYKDKGDEIYQDILSILDGAGNKIDYHKLLYVYNEISDFQGNIPHIDYLLESLIKKRNEDPRIDQMILIFASLLIENSKHPIPEVQRLFVLLLEKDDNRLTEWVISFVASAIGNYPFDMPDGDKLADLVEERLDFVASNKSHSQEYFGFHFLPPPDSEYIKSYLKGIKEQRNREIERIFYYSMIANNVPESQIETILRQIQSNGIPETGETCPLPMKYIFNNINKLNIQINSKDKIKEAD